MTVKVTINKVTTEFSSADTGGNKFWYVFKVANDGSLIVPETKYGDNCETLINVMSGSGKCENSNPP